MLQQMFGGGCDFDAQCGKRPGPHLNYAGFRA